VGELKETMMKLLVFMALASLMFPLTGAAQGCALCYTQAHDSGPRMIQALNDGILVLMVPPIGICLMIMVMAYKKRNKFCRPKKRVEPSDAHADIGW
jgi:hypothetical protein